MIDTHTHLYLDEFAPDNAAAVQRAIDAGVDTMIFPNVDVNTVMPMRKLHEQFPANSRMAIGLHPTEVNDAPIEEQLLFVEEQLASHSDEYIAVGEIGIDLYWDKQYRQQQLEVFARQMTMAAQRGLPVIIHCREGLPEVLEVIDGLDKVPSGVFHSFGGTADDVEQIRRRGDFYFGINGIVTFKNSRLREVLPAIGIDRILLETDAPYLAPVPMRGRRNESAFIIHTAAHIADCLGMTMQAIDAATAANARQLFSIHDA